MDFSKASYSIFHHLTSIFPENFQISLGWVGWVGQMGWVVWVGWAGPVGRVDLSGWVGWSGWMGWSGWVGWVGWVGWLGWVSWVGWLVWLGKIDPKLVSGDSQQHTPDPGNGDISETKGATGDPQVSKRPHFLGLFRLNFWIYG